MTSTPKNTHGGRREGAGRPKGQSRLFAFRADADLARYIDGRANKTRFITDCISRAMAEDVQAASGSPEWLDGMIGADRLQPLRLPFFDVKVAAGFPVPLDGDEQAREMDVWRMLCPHPEASYLIRVRGESMIEAGIASGDILIVDKSNREPLDNQVALCELNGEYTVKYVARREGRLCLVPANKDYPVIEVNAGDDFSVWGVVTYIIHKPQGPCSR